MCLHLAGFIIFSHFGFYVVAPYNVVITGDNLYNHGEELQLNCSSQGGPVLEYTWLLSGHIIDNVIASTLVIDDVSTTDGGDYTCNVTNNAGYQNNNITVYSKLLPLIYVYISDSTLCFCYILSLESLMLS